MIRRFLKEKGFLGVRSGDAQDTGKTGEKEALKFLKKSGYRILEKNFRTRFGEIDLIAKDNNTVVFVEVKTRTGDGFGLPKDAVTLRKKRHILMVSKEYLASKDILPNDVSVRFDVIGVKLNGKVHLEHIKDAFGEE